MKFTHLTAWSTASLVALAIAPLPARAQTAPPGEIVAVNGIEMHYEEKGSGEPLLLLHGFGACVDEWRPFAEVLAKDYRVIMVDLRGHGWSTNPANTFTMRQSGDDIAALLDAMGIERTKAIGISAGGMTLMHLATRHPERVEAMVLIGASTHFPEQAREITRGASWENTPPENQRQMQACAKHGGDQAEQIARQFGGFADSYEDMTFTPPTLATIKARTLIVHGDRDEFFPVDIPVAMYEAIPRSELWIVPDGDHVPIFGKRMPEFLRVAQRFLAEEAP